MMSRHSAQCERLSLVAVACLFSLFSHTAQAQVVLASGSQQCTGTLNLSNITCTYNNTIPNAAIYMSTVLTSLQTSGYNLDFYYGSTPILNAIGFVTGKSTVARSIATCSSISTSNGRIGLGNKLGIWRVDVTVTSPRDVNVSISIGSQDGDLAIADTPYQATQENVTYFTFGLAPLKLGAEYQTSVTVRLPEASTGNLSDVLGLSWDVGSCNLVSRGNPYDYYNRYVPANSSSSTEIVFDLGLQSQGQMNVALLSSDGPSRDLIVFYSAVIEPPSPLPSNGTTCAFVLSSPEDYGTCYLDNQVPNSTMYMDISVVTATPAELSVEVLLGRMGFPPFTLYGSPSANPSVTSYVSPNCQNYLFGNVAYYGSTIGSWTVNVTDVNGTDVAVNVSLRSLGGFLSSPYQFFSANMSTETYFSLWLPSDDGKEMKYPTTFTVEIPSSYENVTSILGVYWFTNATCYLMRPSLDPYSLSQFIPSQNPNLTSVTFDLGKQRSGLVNVGVFLTSDVQGAVVYYSVGEGKPVGWPIWEIIVVSVGAFVALVLVVGGPVWGYRQVRSNDYEGI